MIENETVSDESRIEEFNALKNSRKAFIGHITRIINKLEEKLSCHDNIKIIKCIEEQLYQLLGKFKDTNDKIISLTSDTDDIEKAMELYIEQYNRALNISERIETFAVEQMSVHSHKETFDKNILYGDLTSQEHKGMRERQSSKASVRSEKISSLRNQMTKAETLVTEAEENYERKVRLLEQNMHHQLELEREKITKAKDTLTQVRLELQSNSTINQSPSKHESVYSEYHPNNTHKVYPQRPKETHQEPIDSFIDHLVEGKETIVKTTAQHSVSVMNAIHQELEARNLPPIEPLTFDGNPCLWPEFIENFKSNVHMKQTFNDTIRMERLHNVVKGEAKKLIQSIGRSGIFYATALKALKREFGNSNVVVHAKLNALFSQPQIKGNDRNGIKTYFQNLKCTNTWLVAMGYQSALTSLENVTKAIQRLPNFLRQNFYRNTRDITTCESLSLFHVEEWLENKTKELFNPIANIIASEESTPKNNTQSRYFQNNNIHQHDVKTNEIKCWLCQGHHKVTRCNTFLKKTLAEKKEFVKQKRLCWNCLSQHHILKDCKSENRCRHCQKSHHSLLHAERKIEDNERLPSNNQNNNSHTDMQSNMLKHDQAEAYNNNIKNNSNSTFLQILPVMITNEGKTIYTNALLDSGSDATLIRQDIADKLNLNGNIKSVNMGNAVLDTMKFNSKIVNFEISSIAHPQPINMKNVYVVPNLNINHQRVNIKELQHQFPYLRDVNLPTLNKGDVTVIIGADTPDLHIHVDYRYHSKGQPFAIKTKLGWVLMGGRNSSNEIYSNRINVEELDVNNFWKVEQYGTVKQPDEVLFTKDESEAMRIIKDTIRFKNGHYEIGLLWKENEKRLSYNRDSAVQRFISLEHRLKKNPEVASSYKETISKYVKLKHASKLSEEELSVKNEITNYIPHHYVLNPKKSNKFRIVFDASAKFGDRSLNDCLLKGPDLLNNLVSILMRFRSGTYAVSSDIEKMFHQVYVKEEDRDALRFVYRENDSMPFGDYKMNVHLFGKNDSPCIANYALRQCARDQKDMLSNCAVESINKDFYMDDFVKSHESKQDLIKLSNSVITALTKRGFNLTKWVSNSQDIIEEVNSASKTKDFKESQHTRVLGLEWNTSADTLKICKFKTTVKTTKRSLLGALCSIFDPLGFLAPYLLEAKLIIQESWKRKLEWDDPFPSDLQQRAVSWADNLPLIEQFQINRYHGFNMHSRDLELHLFGDASSRAYGAVAYIRTVENNNFANVAFIIGKNRLAPIGKESLSIPKLELQAAITAVRMKEKILQESNFPIKRIYFWIDSKTVLQYIRNENKHFPAYVMHRVNEIRKGSNIEQWNYIPTSLNVSDMCTRPISLKNLLKKNVYHSGPKLLHQSNIEVHINSHHTNITDQQDTVTCTVINQTKIYQNRATIMWKNFSTWKKLLRAIVTLKTFIRRFKQRNLKNKTEYDKADMYGDARKVIMKSVQEETLKNEIDQLKKQSFVTKNSNLSPLNPVYIDGLLKVGGRINNASSILDSMKHQIILPRDHYVTKLLILDYHESNHHCGRDQTLAYFRQNYWITKAKSVIRSVINLCLTCKRNKARPNPQFMGELPKERLAVENPPFTYTGVDYFGPLIVKLNRGTRKTKAHAKRYGVIFTCLTTRAIHIELATDMSTDNFLLTLQRFIARRGEPDILWSDNGSNFVGADRELRETFKLIDHDKIASKLALRQIKWKFITPSSPWMGGPWEIMVKLVKKALKTVTFERPMFEDALQTFLTEVEATINSRPLVPVSDDPNDLDVLTPNHFLIGRHSKNVDYEQLPENNINIRRKWKAVLALKAMFWKRFIREYIPSLQVRRKWNKKIRNFKINDVVIVQSDNLPKSSWPLARIIEVLKSSDGTVRTCKVKLANSELLRPSNKLCLLEEAT